MSPGLVTPRWSVVEDLAKAERTTISNQITQVATLAAVREATITPKIAAPIAQMPLLTNRTVRAGDILAVLESRDLSAQRAEAAAAVVETEAAEHSIAQGAVPLTNAQDTKAVRDAKKYARSWPRRFHFGRCGQNG